MFLVNMLLNCFGGWTEEDSKPDYNKISTYPLSTRALAALEAKKAAEEAAARPSAPPLPTDRARDWGMVQTSPLEEGIRSHSIDVAYL